MLADSKDRWIRFSLVLFSLVGCAWFAIGVRQAGDTAPAMTFVTTHTTATADQARVVSSLLSSAAVLNPDRTLSLLRGRLASERGNERQAEQIIIRVARDEPQNLDSWLSLAYVSGHNPTLFAQALAQVNRLDPRGG